MKLLEILQQYEHYIDVLLEASDYNMMFPDQFVEKVSATFPKYNRNYFNTAITQAKKILKREDRIVWYLRLLRLEVVFQYYHKTPKTEETKAILDTELKKYNKKSRQNLTWDVLKTFFPMNSKLSALEHFLSLKINDINRYIFKYQTPPEIAKEFLELEEEYNDAMGDEDRLIPENDETLFLDCGNGYKWFNLERGYCSAEAKAMGHCGNEPARYDRNQTILSLRQFVKKGTEGYWKPIATFIYHRHEKSLGEMKGKNNTKPVKRYHPQILKLLYDDRIQAIHGGGYLPEENFSVNDLDEAVRDKLLEAKPRLMTFIDRIEKNGITEEILQDFEEAGAKIDWNPTEYTDYHYILTEADNLLDLVGDFGNDTAKWVMNHIEGGMLDVDWVKPKQFFNDMLTPSQIQILENYAEWKYPEDAENGEDWYNILNDNGDEWFEDFDRIPEDATRFGIESEMVDALIDALDDIHEHEIGAFKQGENVWDSKYLVKLRDSTIVESLSLREDSTSAEEIIEDISNWYLYEEPIEIKVEEPRNGWDGFDEKYFQAEVKNSLEQLEKKTNET